MALNPNFAPRPKFDGEKNPSWKPEKIGDKVVGVILDVSDVLTLKNQKFDPEKDDARFATYKTMVVNIQDENDKKWALWYSEGDFPEIGEALVAAEQDDLKPLVGWTLGRKWDDIFTRKNGNLGKKMKTMLAPPSE